jgi:hypothetical protein
LQPLTLSGPWLDYRQVAQSATLKGQSTSVRVGVSLRRNFKSSRVGSRDPLGPENMLLPRAADKSQDSFVTLAALIFSGAEVFAPVPPSTLSTLMIE